MSANQSTNTPAPDWRELRRQERAARRTARGSSGAWIIGLTLIGVGILLTLQNWYDLAVENWWALFILFPAAGCLAAAWRIRSEEGGAFTLRFFVPLIIELLLLAVTLVFLFNYAVNWLLVLPIVFIGFGILIVVAALVRRD